MQEAVTVQNQYCLLRLVGEGDFRKQLYTFESLRDRVLVGESCYLIGLIFLTGDSKAPFLLALLSILSEVVI